MVGARADFARASSADPCTTTKKFPGTNVTEGTGMLTPRVAAIHSGGCAPRWRFWRFAVLAALCLAAMPTIAVAQTLTVTLAANKTKPQPPNTTIRWTATATGGTAPYTYRFSTSPSGDHNTWTPRQEGSSPEFEWTPTAQNLNFSVSVVVITSTGQIGTPDKFPIIATSVSLAADLNPPQLAGTTINWTATPTGGIPDHSYKFELSPDGGTSWATARNWETAPTWQWQPTEANANYEVRVLIRSSSNLTDTSEGSATVPFAITAPPAGSGWTVNGGNVVLASGNVGIGTLSPAARLHVAGTVLVTGDVVVNGNIGAKYQDVAEWVEAREALPAGTVVMADPAVDNHVQAATLAYEMAVAGVVSAQPGVILGEAGPGKVAVAQSGRVLVKVDASYGPINRGDLLVASPTPGHAMRSEPVSIGGVHMHRPGTILGKALGALATGQGEVLALITLQ
jgi:hypothetical protein